MKVQTLTNLHLTYRPAPRNEAVFKPLPTHLYSRSTPSVYQMTRHEDPSKYSGTGLVAWVIHFPHSGKAVVHWAVPGKPQSVTVFDSLQDARDVHGHDGLARFERVI